MVDFHTRLSAQNIADINAFVKANPPSATIKKELAALTGRSLRTVQSWFDSGPHGRNLIASDVKGVQPMRASLDITDEERQRLFAGMILEGVSGSVFTGAQKSVPGTRATFGGLIDELSELAKHPFTRLALKEFSVEIIPGGYAWTYTYAQPDGDEYPDEFYDEPLSDDEIDEWPAFDEGELKE